LITLPPEASAPHSLRVEQLACRRGDLLLFEGLDFRLDAGQWLHVRGANGIGKTSLLRLLAGLAHPAAGTIAWCDVDIRRCGDAYREALLYVGHLPGAKEDLTPLENLRIAASLDGHPLDERDALAALDRLGLHGREDLPLRYLSQGQKRRVALARLISRKARIWILDEPFTALDAPAVELVTELVRAHVGGGGLALLTSHQAIPLAGGRELTL
jgi:heme exporter protein A